MKLIDRLSIRSLLSMIFSFVLAVLKILKPNNDTIDNPKPRRKRKQS